MTPFNTWFDWMGSMILCPIMDCYAAKTGHIMQRHFMYCHPEKEVRIAGKVEYTKCTKCCMMIRGQVPTAEHMATEQCKAGNHCQLAKQLKETTQEELAAPTTFQVAGCMLKSITEFQYLG